MQERSGSHLPERRHWPRLPQYLVTLTNDEVRSGQPKRRVRDKVVQSLAERKEAITAKLEGRHYQPRHPVTHENETGERVQVSGTGDPVKSSAEGKAKLIGGIRLNKLIQAGLFAIVSGTVASIASTAALALLARADGKGALQPTNATSHWLHGEQAGSFSRADVAHTLVGYGTHHASAVFWALPFEIWLASRPPRVPLLLLRDASVISMIAAAVDYGATPKRLTPGWELVLSKRSILATYGAMALGLTAGALITQQWRSEG